MSTGAISFNNIISTRITNSGNSARSGYIQSAPAITEQNSKYNGSSSSGYTGDDKAFFTPIMLDYKMLVEFSNVKYMPSNAANPDEYINNTASSAYNKAASSEDKKPYYRVEAII